MILKVKSFEEGSSLAKKMKKTTSDLNRVAVSQLGLIKDKIVSTNSFAKMGTFELTEN